MIPRAFEEISGADLQNLIDNAVAEGRTIEYKQALPGGADSERKEFLADVSSFANTSGGDLIYGISEDKGVPTGVVGIGTTDPDLEVRRLDSIIAAGLEPRIRYNSRIVETEAALKVLLVRIEKSWFGPHRVIFKGHDKFYGRNVAGKYPLDVNELRVAFTIFSGSLRLEWPGEPRARSAPYGQEPRRVHFVPTVIAQISQHGIAQAVFARADNQDT